MKAKTKDKDSKPLTVVAHVSERIIVRVSIDGVIKAVVFIAPIPRPLPTMIAAMIADDHSTILKLLCDFHYILINSLYLQTSPSITDVEVDHPILLPSARELTFSEHVCVL